MSDGSTPHPTRRLAPWAVAVGAALMAAWVHASTHRGEVFTSLADEVLLVPLALRFYDAGLYPGDHWLDLAEQVFSVPYSVLVGALLGVIEDPVAALRLLALPFHVVFLATSWLVARRSGVWALVFLAVLPPMAHVLGPAMALPRDLVFATLPGFWLWAARARGRGPWQYAAVLFAAGLIANLHPLTAVHLAWLLLGVHLVRDGLARDLRYAAAGSLAFLAGAAPYAWQYLARPATPGMAPESVLAWRVGNIGAESWSAWAARMEPIAWVALAVVLLGRIRRVERTADEVLWIRAALVAAAIAALGPLVSRWIDPLRAFQLGRYTRFALWFLALAAARRAHDAGKLDGAPRRLAALTLAAAALVLASDVGKRLTGLVRGSRPDRAPLTAVVRKLERKLLGAPALRPAPEGFPTRERLSDPARDAPPGSRSAFVDVCRFARETTDVDALFLVPPEDWGAFRAYARRSTAVTRKEGGFALTFLGGRGNDWLVAYRDAVGAYAGDQAAWVRAAERHGATHAVIDRGARPPLGWREVFAAGPYTVFARR